VEAPLQAPEAPGGLRKRPHKKSARRRYTAAPGGQGITDIPGTRSIAEHASPVTGDQWPGL